MSIGYFGLAALTASSLLFFASSNTSADIYSQTRAQIALEQRVSAQPRETLHSRLAKKIAEKEEELFLRAEAGDNVSEQIGFLVYYDLEGLANRFERTVNLNKSKVYTIGKDIIVEDDLRRIVFYSNNEALEKTGFYDFEAVYKKLKIVEINGKERVLEDLTNFERDFSYVRDMHEFDFSKIYSAVRALRAERSKMRRVEPKDKEWALSHYDPWNLSHPVDGVKFGYIRGVLEMISSGLFKRYGLHAEFGARFFNEGDIIMASDKMICVAGYRGWSYATKYFELLVLVIRDKSEAMLTTIIKAKNQPDKIETKPVYPRKP